MFQFSCHKSWIENKIKIRMHARKVVLNVFVIHKLVRWLLELFERKTTVSIRHAILKNLLNFIWYNTHAALSTVTESIFSGNLLEGAKL